jgi:hypothetical protein
MIPDVSRLTFVSHPDEFIARDDDFIARVPVGIADRQALFRALAKELKFPAYFGRNWDALDELLRDFSWKSSQRIIVVHDELPVQVGEDNLKIYLTILIDSVKDWKPGEEHELVVVFPTAYREQIQQILQN